jgi:PGF-pre-PGF domain-containing protein
VFRSIKRGVLVSLIVVLLFMFSGSVSAAEGNSTNCGFVNTNFTLAANLASNGTCYTLNASDIIMDGGGFSITGNTTGSGILINGSFTNVTVKNFAGIDNFTNGIYTHSSDNNTVFNSTIQYNVNSIYINLTLRSNVSSNTLLRSSYNIYLDKSNESSVISNTADISSVNSIYLTSSFFNIITSNSVSNSSRDPYYLTASDSNTFTENIANYSGQSGFEVVSSDHNIFTSNNVTVMVAAFISTGNGFFLQGSSTNNTLDKNTIANVSNEGILITSDSNVIIRNTIFNSSKVGMSLSSADGNNISWNTIHHGLDHGIELLGDRNTFYSNRVYENSGPGIYSSSTLNDDNIYINNTVYNISGDGIWSSGTNSTFVQNSAYNNSGSGFIIQGSSHNFTGNTAFSNSVYGFYLQQSGHAFKQNIIYDNTLGGMRFQDSDNNNFTEDQINDTDEWLIYSDSGSTGNRIDNMLLQGTINFTTHEFLAISIRANSTPPNDPSHKKNLSNYFDINNTHGSGWISFNISYLTSALAGILEATSKLYRYNSSWQAAETSGVNANTNTVFSGNLTNLSWTTLGLFGNYPVAAVIFHMPVNYSNQTSDFVINVTAENASYASYRYENTTFNSSWTQMTNPASDYWNATFNLSTIVDGTYAIRINGSDGSTVNTTTTITFTKDTTGPSVTLFNNPTANSYNNASFVLNVTVTGDPVNVTYRIENGTNPNILIRNDTIMTNSASNFWNVTINISDLEQSNYTIRINTTDLFNNTNTSQTITIGTDTTMPNITSFSCSDITAGGSQSCTCTATDNSENYTGSVSTSISSGDTSSAGTQTVTCTATDSAGNTNTSTASYTVNAADSSSTTSSSGSSIGSSGTISKSIPGQVTKKVWTRIDKGSKANLDIKDKEVSISNIEFTAKEQIRGASITVSKKESPPTATKSLNRKIHSYIEITRGPSVKAELISDAKISFHLEKSWLEENKLDKENIAMFRYNEEEWNALETKITEETDSLVNYASTTPGFSLFAIGEKEEIVGPKQTEEEEIEETTEPEAEEESEQETEQQEEAEQEITVPETKNGLLIVLVILLLGIVGYYFYSDKPKKKRKKK